MRSVEQAELKSGKCSPGQVRDCSPEPISRVSRWVGIALVALGLLVLVGWALQIATLKSVVPGFASMKPNTAIGFVLAGLCLTYPEIRFLRVSCAIVVAAIGALALAEHLVGIRFVIEDVFSYDARNRLTVYPGVISSVTAMNLLFAGMALLLIRSRARFGQRVVVVLAFLLGSTSLVAVLGYAYGVEELYRLPGYGKIALHTAAGFLLLAMGILWARPDGIENVFVLRSPSGRILRWLFPLAIITPALIGGLAVGAERAGWLSPVHIAALGAYAGTIILAVLTWNSARILAKYDAERARADTALKDSEERFRSAFAQAAIGFSVMTPDGRYVDVNATHSAITGYSLDALRNTGFEMLVFPEDYPENARQLQRLLAGEISHFISESRYLRKDGTLVWVRKSISLVRTPEGAPKWILSLVEDISERKKAEEALAEAKAVAEQASRAKDHFLAVLSHELRTPLTPVLTLASFLETDPDLPDGYREDVAMIRRNVELEARLIDDLLDVTRIVRGKLELSRKVVDLRQVLQRAVEICQPDIEARDLVFTSDCGADAPYWVDADPARLQQVFWNVIKNAIKFTPHGGTVGVRCSRRAREFVVEIKDTGAGIEPDLLPHIFNAFEQGGAATTRQFGGLGLGLAITKGLLDAHGGAIRVTSEGRNRGSTFIISLPEVPAPDGVRGEPGPGQIGPAWERPLRILVVEDHGDSARMMARFLELSGHKVTLAGDVATALQYATAEEFDLLVSDLGLPDGTGIELLQDLRRRGYSTPAIALSGFAQEEDLARCKAAGFAAHLTKPANREQLSQAILAAVRENRAVAV